MPRLRKIVSAIAMVAAWMLVTGSPASASSCPNTNVQVRGLSQSAMERSISCLINEQRGAYGVPPVQPNAELRQAALSHSSEMVSLGYFEHTSPAGLTFVNRIAATGYTRGARSWEVGENLVWGTGVLSTPGSLVTSWMNSPPHRENLLRSNFNEIGIAAEVGTPRSRLDLTGVTVSSEYGFRSFAKKSAKTETQAKAKKKGKKKNGKKEKKTKKTKRKRHKRSRKARKSHRKHVHYSIAGRAI